MTRWTVDRKKYLTGEMAAKLIGHCRSRAELGAVHGGKCAAKAWLAVDIGLGAGLRVSEIADLRCGDCFTGYGESHLHVRNGKGGKAADVIIGQGLKKHIKQFIRQKRDWGEATGTDSYLLTPRSGEGYTRSALEKAFKTAAREAGLPAYLSIHALRHTFCFRLLAESKNIRLVQLQARHSNIGTTMTYAHVGAAEIQSAMDAIA